MNIIFSNTLNQMSIPCPVWKKSRVTLYGVVPGRAASSLGKIRLEVVFGEKGNYIMEVIEFEIVDWESEYHAILGRPTFITFMAVPHYAYLKLKMPDPAGTITVNGSFTQSDQCDRNFYKLSDSLGAQQELSEIAMVVDRSIFPLASRREMKEITRDFSVDGDTTTHQVHPTD